MRFRLPDWLLAAALLMVFGTQAVLSSLPKAPVADAWAHYLFGQWALGYPYSPKRLPAWDGTMPVSALNVVCSAAGSRLGATDAVTVEGVKIPSLLFARLPNILMGTGLLFCVWLYARAFVGRRTALLALMLGVFEPNLIGHSRFITTDIPAAFGFTIASLSVAAWVIRPSWFLGLSAVALLAMAQLAKTSNLLLYPMAVAVILTAAFLPTDGRLIKTPERGAGQSANSIGPFPGRAFGRRPLVWLALSLLFFFCSLHLGYSGFSRQHEEKVRQMENQNPAPLLGKLLPVTFRATISIGRAHNSGGHPAYLFGHHSTRGWWYYFPAAILVKTPLPLLLLALAGVVLLCANPDRLIVAVLPGILYLVVFCAVVHVNIGIRHVLSVYSALLLLAGHAANQLWSAVHSPGLRRSFTRALALLGVFCLPAWTVFEAARIFPHYESYFNELVGGTCNGWKALGDSNLAWGQDDWIVEAWVRKQNRPVIVNPLAPTKGLIAVRADLLAGLTPEMAKQFAWLSQKHKPACCLTPGVLVYDIPIGDSKNREIP